MEALKKILSEMVFDIHYYLMMHQSREKIVERLIENYSDKIFALSCHIGQVIYVVHKENVYPATVINSTLSDLGEVIYHYSIFKGDVEVRVDGVFTRFGGTAFETLEEATEMKKLTEARYE